MKQRSYVMILKWICVLAIIYLGFLSCSERKNPYLNDLGIDPTLMAEMDIPNYTEISWLDTLIDLGSVKAGDTIYFNYRFRNTGTKPLFVINTRTTCGCTLGQFSKEPVWQNEEGMIKARYAWSGDTGTFKKYIAVHTNTANGNWHRLAFTGKVVTDSTKKQ